MKIGGTMYWKKLSRRMFSGRRHIGIILFPTSQCDTGCSHCIDNSDCENPVHFTKELAETIIKQVRDQKWRLSVLFTGGGEPLLVPELLEIADTFGHYERLYSFMFITSGFLNRDVYRKQQLQNLLTRKFVKKISVQQSFNLYHPSFPERLANTTRLMIELKKQTSLIVRTCASVENWEETAQKIEEVTKKIAEELKAEHVPIPKDKLKDLRKKFPIYLCSDKEIENDHQVDKFANPKWHAIKTGKGTGALLIILPISFEQTGRGVNINQTPFAPSMCHAVTRNFHDTYLIVGPDGSVYPDCSCYPTQHMRLGKIGEDSLVELVRRKDVFEERIGKAIETDSRICTWGTSEVCTLCKQIVLEKGIKLQ